MPWPNKVRGSTQHFLFDHVLLRHYQGCHLNCDWNLEVLQKSSNDAQLSHRWVNEQMYTVRCFDGGTEYSIVLVTIVKVLCIANSPRCTEMDFKKKVLYPHSATAFSFETKNAFVTFIVIARRLRTYS
jgi:hypothetical protein